MSKNLWVEPSIYKTKNETFVVKKFACGQVRHFGTYTKIEDAREVRDALVAKFGEALHSRIGKQLGKEHYLKVIEDM